ncbi:hypothetical protein ElyMa_005602900 [Elysia marginata]|uniref:Uncharacterized protein n=1 Tax=Elysia marginata TaxID=1093978 RepID=A0AAV4F5D1_9GAST|nr:hypothetical protein ElyMa_005602900 [Elysia marginata]
MYTQKHACRKRQCSNCLPNSSTDPASLMAKGSESQTAGPKQKNERRPQNLQPPAAFTSPAPSAADPNGPPGVHPQSDSDRQKGARPPRHPQQTRHILNTTRHSIGSQRKPHKTGVTRSLPPPRDINPAAPRRTTRSLRTRPPGSPASSEPQQSSPDNTKDATRAAATLRSRKPRTAPILPTWKHAALQTPSTCDDTDMSPSRQTPKPSMRLLVGMILPLMFRVAVGTERTSPPSTTIPAPSSLSPSLPAIIHSPTLSTQTDAPERSNGRSSIAPAQYICASSAQR